MRIGIIAEGKSDVAVITNILKGKLNIDSSDVLPLLPELHLDETDLGQINPDNFSNWTLVKQSCIDKEKFEDFFNGIDGNEFIIIQIDTAERNEIGFDVISPKDKKNNADYYEELRGNVISEINNWLDNHYKSKIRYAISIEETEAWLLTILEENTKETGKHTKPKEHFRSLLNKKLSRKKRNILKNDIYSQYLELSKQFSKKKYLKQYLDRNESLRLFCQSLEDIDF